MGVNSVPSMRKFMSAFWADFWFRHAPILPYLAMVGQYLL